MTYKREVSLTDEEQSRFNEIVFYKLIQEALLKYGDPTKIQAFIEVICSIAECSYSAINSVVSTIMTEDRDYKPTLEEQLILMYKTKVPVKEACATLQMSMSTYYALVKAKHYPIQPKYRPQQYIAIMKFLETVQNILAPLERRGL